MSKSLDLVEDLPRDARAVVARAGTEIDDLETATHAAIDRIQKSTDAQVARLRKQLEKEVARLQGQADQEVTALAAEGERQVQGRVAQVVAELEGLQQSYFQQAKLDETLAVRSQIKSLQENPSGAEPDPGNLSGLASQVGKTFHFAVTGAKTGHVWGTDVYTSDSLLACAAVHAGKVRPGEQRVVRVTIVPPPARYKGSKRNGVTSHSYGAWGGAYRIG